MATAGNKDWAVTEAKRRAQVMGRDYAIYRHKIHTEDHIIRPTVMEAPDAKRWECIQIERV